MTALRKFVPRYTVDDYSQWKGDWELWDGVPIAMSPSPFGRHAELMASLITQLKIQIDQHECDARVLPEIDWILSDITVVRPDISVVCGPTPQRHIESVPALVAEILSPSTRSHDQTYKRELYRDEGVANYLIVDPDANELTFFHDQETGDWNGTIKSDVFEIQICDDCQLTIDPVKLFR